MFAWVRGADLGTPFVPEVCKMTARSCRPGSGWEASMGRAEAMARSHDTQAAGTAPRS